jgi:predicted  nucleic acid-binding Zn-ribbon protein
MADDGAGYVCTQCGRQHPTDMSTCECGSASFRPVSERLTRRCTECGALVAKGVDSCPECGFRSFEPLDAGPTAGEVATGYEEWQCTECGRSHQRNNPPCKRCGNGTFERVSVDAEEVNPSDYVGGRPWYRPDRNTAAMAAVAVLLVAVVGAGLLGVGPLAPEQPWTATVDGEALAADVVAELNGARQAEGVAPLSTDESLRSAAAARAGDLAAGDGGEPVAARVTACDARGTLFTAAGSERPPGGGNPTPAQVADALVSQALEGENTRDRLLDAGIERVGIGVASGDGRLFVVVATC